MGEAMTEAGNAPRWLLLCERYRIDPAELKVVFARYQAHRRFAQQGGDGAIPLERWFRFYVLEKSSEGEQAGIFTEAPHDTINDACLARPRRFLEVLQAYSREEPDA